VGSKVGAVIVAIALASFLSSIFLVLHRRLLDIRKQKLEASSGSKVATRLEDNGLMPYVESQIESHFELEVVQNFHM